jgi:two-component system, NarL family, sensor histidine kinase DesK
MKYIDFSIERISAWATWTVVSCSSLLMMVQSNRFSVSYLVFTGLLFVLYLVLWNLISENDEKHVPSKGQLFTSILLYFVIIAIYFAAPVSFVAIFMLIFSAITPYYMSLKRAVMLSPILALPLVLVYHFYWQQESAFISGVLFWTFNIFALIMVNTIIRERDARLEAEMTSRNLEATQTLLNEAVKQSERVRITRNIHDLLGHHLTALAINFQVASHKSEGEVKESIEQCRQLAKLLLSDVREAVSDIRDKSKLDLETSIFSMLERLPKLKIDL